MRDEQSGNQDINPVPDKKAKASQAAPSPRSPDTNSGVRKVKSINEPGSSQFVGSDAPPSGGSGFGPINAIRNGLSDLIGGGARAMKNGIQGLIGSGFGMKPLGKGVVSSVTAVGSFLHISPVAAGVTMALAVSGGLGTGAVLLHQNSMNNMLVQQEEFVEDDCGEEVEDMKSSANMGAGDDMTEEYAAKMWAVAKAIGLTDEQAAGMLGNCAGEGAFDPTSIETIFDEPFNIDGPRKAAARDDLSTFTLNVVFNSYPNLTLNHAGYLATDGSYCCGIGLFQFTGDNGRQLQDYAKAGNMDWWEFDLQMAFAIDPTGGYGGGGGGAAWIPTWSPPGSVDQAAVEFNKNYEGSTIRNAEKSAAAQEWYAKFKGQTGDQAYAESIIALADSISGGMSAGKAAADAEEECAEATKSFDNGDLARAAVAYAYETTAEGNGNNGTELYRFVHDTVAPGDGWYQSCDRGVATAVRWSDYDDDFPMGATDQQDAFCQANSAQWEHIGEFGVDVQFDDLEPGDILITNAARRTSCSMGHIVIYVSNEIVKEKFPNSNATFVSASFEERSPGCEDWSDGKFFGDGYYVYRCAQPDNSGQFKDIAEGKNLKDR